MSYSIAVGGENLVDLVETGLDAHGFPLYTAYPGGGPYNVAIAAARQKAPVSYLTPVSDDRFGTILTQNLTKAGAQFLAPRVPLPTSLAVVSTTDGQACFQFYRHRTAERQVSLPLLMQLLDDLPSFFHVGSLALAEDEDGLVWEEFFTALHQKGVITSIDPNVRPDLIPDRRAYLDRIERMVRIADIVKLSDADVTWLYPELNAEDAFDHICSIAGDGLKVMTKGAEGAVASSDGASLTVAAHPVPDLIDTVGAGDTFMATMLVWLGDNTISERQAIYALDHTELASMLDKAGRAAAINCMSAGCNPPSADEIVRSE